jgi:8-oxo-dGTP diphosphatase
MAQCAFAIVRKADEVLLVQIAPPFNHAHKWNFPGGVIEQGEDIKEGLVREVFEESGVTCRILSLRDRFIFPDSGDEIFIYDAVFIKGDLYPQEEEILAARWVTLDVVSSLALAYNIDTYLIS